MLDIQYPSLRAFVRDCRAAAAYLQSGTRQITYIDVAAHYYSARDLLESGAYVLEPSGYVTAAEYV